MDDSNVRIDELRLVVPGLTHTQAQRLGQAVAQRLAERLPAQLSTLQFGALDVRMPVRAGTNLEQLADAIVTGILRRLA